ncbi:polysaccharide deacetylase family protein [Clostridium polynesiense]|uniref:polysaccharide deacetylase family protein n=1 Tax=Clostridium polynesiense TaxID=1325933 RepID=UPI0006943524|nr:polysaccharide deacetylase family protein [Clostridium polynesiense]
MSDRLEKRRDKRNKVKKAVLFFTVSILSIGLGLGTAYFTSKYVNNSSGENKNILGSIQDKMVLGNRDSEDKNTEKEPEVKKPLPTDVNKGSNTSIEGDKFTFSAVDAQKANEYKLTADGNKMVFLTFDDGPSPKSTPAILNILKENDVKATFFVLGKNVDKTEDHKSILKQTLEEGHAIGNHSNSHNYDKLYPGRSANLNNITEDFETANKKLQEVLGEDFQTKVVRFPGGGMSWKNMQPVKEAFAAKGIAFLDWNIDSTDARSKNRTKEQIVSAITKELDKMESANIDKITILMHDTDAKKSTVEALPEIISLLKSRGYAFKTLK